VVHDNDGNERAAAGYLQIPLGLAQAAIAYYGAYRDEIDEWIELYARERSEQSLSDPDVVALARTEHRAVLTANLRDFRPMHSELVAPGAEGHAGMVFVPTSFRLTRAAHGPDRRRARDAARRVPRRGGTSRR